ncbi:MFS transporter [Elioraea rosea]|uniref:MFS transporter n=1 Tax=Elioraea rosea TaxID=2492390 RepID=UPI001EF689E0|nr:MFS transporter [Elioraea rosea]
MTSPSLAAPAPAADTAPQRAGANLAIILSLSFCHMLNDMMQSLLPALYPVLKDQFALDFAQIGLLTLAFQCTASMLQPAVGLYTDRNPLPYSMAIGMGATLVGLVLLATAWSYPLLVLAAMLIGCGSAVFHPEASRVARAAAGGRYGLAQSIFQVGGNTGSAIGPLLAAFVVVPAGQGRVLWFSGAALLASLVLSRVGAWYSRARRAPGKAQAAAPQRLSRGKVLLGITVLIVLLFSKNFYSAALTSFFTFYLIERFDVSIQTAQLFLFAYLAGLAGGILAGGWIGDRIGRIPVIWFSILGALPFTLILPYANLFWTGVLATLIGLIMSSAFSAIIVYAQDLMPGRIGFVSGLFFGLSFGLGGLGAAAMGALADWTSIETVYGIVSFLPLLGLATALLPRVGGPAEKPQPASR